jgi:hypothetical protein
MGNNYKNKLACDYSKVDIISSMRITLKPFTILRIEGLLNRRIHVHSVDADLNKIFDTLGDSE